MCYEGKFNGVRTPGKNEVTKAAFVSMMLKAALLFVRELKFLYFKPFVYFSVEFAILKSRPRILDQPHDLDRHPS
jgi:hypothetical protein